MGSPMVAGLLEMAPELPQYSPGRVKLAVMVPTILEIIIAVAVTEGLADQVAGQAEQDLAIIMMVETEAMVATTISLLTQYALTMVKIGYGFQELPAETAALFLPGNSHNSKRPDTINHEDNNSTLVDRPGKLPAGHQE